MSSPRPQDGVPAWVLPACALAGLVVAVVAVLAAGALGTAVPWSAALAGGLAAGVVVGLGLRLTWSDPAPPPDPPSTRVATTSELGDFASLLFTVENASRDADRFETRVRPRLVTLAVDRLWQAHAVDWRTDEGRRAALALVGPHLHELLTAPAGQLRLTPSTLTTWLDDLESL